MEKIKTRNEILTQDPLLQKLDTARKEYRKKVCSKCIGTEKQNKRCCMDAGLYRGARITKCAHMISAINKKYGTEINKEYSEMLKPLFSLHNSQRND